MKRIKISIFLLITIITFCIFAVTLTYKRSLKLISMLDNLEIVYENGDTAQSLNLANEITSYWEEYYKQSAVLVKTDKLYSAQECIYRLVPFIENDSEELSSEIECSKQKIRWIYETELPFLRNIF